jgi:hypothetical protein
MPLPSFAQMPVVWRLQQGVLLVTLMGDYPFEELRSAVAEALRSPDFSAGTSILFDARSSLKYPSTDVVRSIAEWLASLRAQGVSARSAMVISRERYRLGERATVHFHEQGLETALFASLAEAMRWLGPEGG